MYTCTESNTYTYACIYTTDACTHTNIARYVYMGTGALASELLEIFTLK